MKNYRAILLLLLANTISGISQGISMIAIPWYFARDGEMTLFGWVYILANVVSIFWVPYSGTLIDRFNRKHVFLSINAVCGSIILGIAAYGLIQGALPWQLVGFVFMITFFNFNIHYPTLYAFVQEITEPKHYGRITSYLEIQGQTALILAGGCAAILLEGTHNGVLGFFGFSINLGWDIKPWKISEIFALDAATYFVAFVILLLIRYTSLKERANEVGTLKSRLKTGYDFLIKNPLILIFGIASYSVFVTVLIEGFYLNALYVSNHLEGGGDVYAASEMYYSLGALVAGFATRYLLGKAPIPTLILIATLIVAGRFFLLAITLDFFIFYAMSFLLGISNAGTRILRVTYLFRHIPNQVYGRTGSIFFLSNILFRILFVAVFNLAFFQQDNNIVYGFGIVSIFLLLTAVILALYRKRFCDVPAITDDT